MALKNTKARKATKRQQAEARQAEYNELSPAQKLAKAGAKQKRKLLAKS